MSINTQKLLDEIERRYAALDSTSSLSEIQRVSELNTRKDAPILTGAIQYGSLNQANAPSGIGDSAKVGEIFFVADQQLDSNGRFYFRSQAGFINMKSPLDSSENASITAASTPTPSTIAYAGANAYHMYELVGKFNMSSTTTASGIPALGTNLFPDFSRGRASGRSSTKGYYMFNYSPNDTSIDAFPFAAEDAMTDTTGTLTQVRKNMQGEPVGDGTVCYAVGGFNPGIGIVNTVDKFPTAADDQAGTDVGDLTVARSMQAHVSSTTFGYAAGGGGPPGAQNVIDKFPFATDANATDVGDLLNPSQALAGASSTTHGYAAGGHGTPAPGNRRDNIDKFAFASDGNSTDVGNLASSKDNTGGASSASYGFALGGAAGNVGNTIHRWSFSSDGNATDYADLHESTRYAATTHDTA